MTRRNRGAKLKAMLKTMSILLVASLLAGCRTTLGGGSDKDRSASDRLEAQAIGALFDSVEPGELDNESFGAMIVDTPGYYKNLVPMESFERPAAIVTWFKFARDQEVIRLNYLSFPRREEYDGPFNDDWPHKRLTETLMKIVSDGGIRDIPDIKQLRIFTPKALQDDGVLNGMFKDKKAYHVRMDGYSPSYYWGFKTKSKEVIAYNFNYSGDFLTRIEEEILAYIMDAILCYDTPEDWKLQYIISWNNDVHYPPGIEECESVICNYNARGKKIERMKRVAEKMGRKHFD